MKLSRTLWAEIVKNILESNEAYLAEDGTERCQTRFARLSEDFRECFLRDVRQFFRKFLEAVRNPLLKTIKRLNEQQVTKLIDSTWPRVLRFASINHVFAIHTTFLLDKIALEDSLEWVDVPNGSWESINYQIFLWAYVSCSVKSSLLVMSIIRSWYSRPCWTRSFAELGLIFIIKMMIIIITRESHWSKEIACCDSFS